MSETTDLPASAATADAGTRGGSRARRLLGGVPALLVAALVVWLWPASLGGCTSFVVVSGTSMEPTYAPGDLLVARCGTPAVGDVAVYRPPSVPEARVVHRVVGGGPDGWLLQGDANDWVDPWQPDDAHVVGRVVGHVPGLGLTLVHPLVWLGVLVVGCGLRLWPDDEPDADHEPVPDDDRLPDHEPVPEVERVTVLGPRARRVAASTAAVTALLALAALPRPAHAAALPVTTGSVLAWSASAAVPPPPPPPAATCSTPDPDLPCTVEVQLGDAWDGGYNVRVLVRDVRPGGSAAQVPWTVTLDLSATPFPWVPDVVSAAGLVAASTCDELPVLTVTGTTTWGSHHLLGPGEYRDVWLQGTREPVDGALLVCR